MRLYAIWGKSKVMFGFIFSLGMVNLSVYVVSSSRKTLVDPEASAEHLNWRRFASSIPRA